MYLGNLELTRIYAIFRQIFMTLTKFLISVGIVTLCSWLAWVTVLLYIDPELSGMVGIGVFYASLFFALLGTFTLLGLSIRILLKRLHRGIVIAFQFVSPSIRQAIWFSVAVVVCLLLSAAKLFNWWSVGLLMISLIVLEAFYLTKKHTTRV